MLGHQGEGLGGGEDPAQPQAIGQPVPVSLQKLQRGGRGPQPPALRQLEACQGGFFAGIQGSAAAVQLDRFEGGQGWRGDHGGVLGRLGLFCDGLQLRRDGIGDLGAVGRAGGLQRPSFPLQQPGDGGAVREALPVAVGPQLGPGLQEGPSVVAILQRSQQRIRDGP